MNSFSRVLTRILIVVFLVNYINPITVSHAEEKYDKIVVSLGDSYSSGEGIEDFYGYHHPFVNDTYAWVKGEDGKDYPKYQFLEDFLAHRSEGSWPGQLVVEGIGELKNKKGTQWFFEAVSGATARNLGMDDSYLDCIVEMNQNKMEKGLITSNEVDDINKQILNVRLDSIKEDDKEKWPINQTKPMSSFDIKKEYTLPYQLNIFDEIDCSKIEYVTMTMGGNDIGFIDIVREATVLGGPFDVNGLENKLKAAEDLLKNKVKYILYASYFAIQDKAGKQAKILIAGYPKLFSNKIAPQIIFPFDRQTLIPEYATKFNSIIEEVVDDCRINGGLNIFFISVEGDEYFGGHEAYTKDPYIYGIDLISNSQDLALDMYSARSMHPNKKGAKAYADAVQTSINRFEKNGMISGFICIDDDTYADEYSLKANNVNSIKLENTTTGKLYDISLSKKYKGYYETYIPEGNYKILVEYSTNSSPISNKKYVQYGSSFDAEFCIKNGEIIKDADFIIGNEKPRVDVFDPELEDEYGIILDEQNKENTNSEGDVKDSDTSSNESYNLSQTKTYYDYFGNILEKGFTFIKDENSDSSYRADISWYDLVDIDKDNEKEFIAEYDVPGGGEYGRYLVIYDAADYTISECKPISLFHVNSLYLAADGNGIICVGYSGSYWFGRIASPNYQYTNIDGGFENEINYETYERNLDSYTGTQIQYHSINDISVLDEKF